MGLLWDGRTVTPAWRRWLAVVVRGRGATNPAGAADGPDIGGTRSAALSLLDLRFQLRLAGPERAWTFEAGPTMTPCPCPRVGGGLAVAYGTGGPAGLAVRFDTTVFRTAEATSAVFSLGVLFGVAGYRD